MGGRAAASRPYTFVVASAALPRRAIALARFARSPYSISIPPLWFGGPWHSTVRELMPQDLKIEIEQLSREQATAIAGYLAGVVGRAHARQMDGATRRSWKAELARNRSKTLDAPSWLWLSVVELMGSHEAAYLDHCRRYAWDEA